MNQRLHHRFAGKLHTKLQIIDRGNDQVLEELAVRVVNASFSGARVACRAVTAETTSRLAHGAHVRLFVDWEDDSRAPLDAMAIWMETKPGKFTLGMSWHQRVPGDVRMWLIEHTHETAPDPRRTWIPATAAIAFFLGVGLSLVLRPLRLPAVATAHHGVSTSANDPTLRAEEMEQRRAFNASAAAGTVAQSIFQKSEDFHLSTDMEEGAVIAVSSAALAGHHLAIALAPRIVIPADKSVYANVSITDGLGNTVLECVWRDVQFTGEAAQSVACDLPMTAVMPLSLSGHQSRLPSFVETSTLPPGVVPLYAPGVEPRPSQYARTR